MYHNPIIDSPSYYRSHLFRNQGNLPDGAFKNRQIPNYYSQIPQGRQYFQPSNKKHFQFQSYRSQIQDQKVIKGTYTEEEIQKSRIAMGKSYFRSLNIDDIEGAKPNTLISKAVKNKQRAHSLAKNDLKNISPSNHRNRQASTFIKSNQPQGSDYQKVKPLSQNEQFFKQQQALDKLYHNKNIIQNKSMINQDNKFFSQRNSGNRAVTLNSQKYDNSSQNQGKNYHFKSNLQKASAQQQQFKTKNDRDSYLKQQLSDKQKRIQQLQRQLGLKSNSQLQYHNKQQENFNNNNQYHQNIQNQYHNTQNQYHNNHKQHQKNQKQYHNNQNQYQINRSKQIYQHDKLNNYQKNGNKIYVQRSYNRQYQQLNQDYKNRHNNRQNLNNNNFVYFKNLKEPKQYKLKQYTNESQYKPNSYQQKPQISNNLQIQKQMQNYQFFDNEYLREKNNNSPSYQKTNKANLESNVNQKAIKNDIKPSYELFDKNRFRKYNPTYLSYQSQGARGSFGHAAKNILNN